MLDAIGSLLCFMTAVAVFTIHVLSSPRKKHWIDLPAYVRWGLFGFGASLLYRGVNLATLSSEWPPQAAGHINPEALVTLVILSYTFMAWAVHTLRRTFPVRVYDRLKYIEGLALCSKSGSLAILASLGFKVVPPKADPKTVATVTRLTDHV